MKETLWTIAILCSITLFFVFYINELDKANEKTISDCSAKKMVIYHGSCVDVYSYCSDKAKNTYSNITDTWGVSQNNQDTISKTIQSEIERCMLIYEK